MASKGYIDYLKQLKSRVATLGNLGRPPAEAPVDIVDLVDGRTIRAYSTLKNEEKARYAEELLENPMFHEMFFKANAKIYECFTSAKANDEDQVMHTKCVMEGAQVLREMFSQELHAAINGIVKDSKEQ